MSADLTQVGRLAMRHEGENWNAYYALKDTMDGAIYLGSIRMTAVDKNPDRKEAFMELMRGIISDILAGATGQEPIWSGSSPAPERERSGHS